jgi:hypothetical protein
LRYTALCMARMTVLCRVKQWLTAPQQDKFMGSVIDTMIQKLQLYIIFRLQVQSKNFILQVVQPPHHSSPSLLVNTCNATHHPPSCNYQYSRGWIHLWSRYTTSGRVCGLVVRVPGYRSRGPGFHFWRYKIFWVVVGLEQGPLSLVGITEELLEWKRSGSGLENWD